MTEKTERYGVRLLVRHPSLNPEGITTAIALQPNNSWRVGMPRVTVKGELLEGVYPDSMWSHSYNINGRKNFSKDISDILDILDRNVQFIQGVVSSGGTVKLIINLAGDVNVGDEIEHRDLVRLSNLKISLGFEVFPDFN